MEKVSSNKFIFFYKKNKTPEAFLSHQRYSSLPKQYTSDSQTESMIKNISI